ncbi:hypothetical protein Patl1_19644 [Pistacia atlantica]|uniref:Uncharacterized protein n=1 Tax=Pistacia atlantica TaxID=434234 RepID=A0ACC1BXH0_9ROSI|nr:hypothetical protein Patl1_19644 [Pistacia atlantica]
MDLEEKLKEQKLALLNEFLEVERRFGNSAFCIATVELESVVASGIERCNGGRVFVRKWEGFADGA